MGWHKNDDDFSTTRYWLFGQLVWSLADQWRPVSQHDLRYVVCRGDVQLGQPRNKSTPYQPPWSQFKIEFFKPARDGTLSPQSVLALFYINSLLCSTDDNPKADDAPRFAVYSNQVDNNIISTVGSRCTLACVIHFTSCTPSQQSMPYRPLQVGK